MPNYAFLLEYDGSKFAGWQRQASDQRSVQGTLEEALGTVSGAPVATIGAGRTDAGVHAEGQVASGEVETRLGAGALLRALNGVLPRDVAVRGAAEVGPAFHALRDARGKHYRYSVWAGEARSPLRRTRYAPSPLPRPRLELGAMRRAAAALVGTHDFRAFQSTGSSPATTVRTLSRVELVEAGDALEIEVEGEGFLRHMVRTLAGTLLEVGAGRRDPASIPELLGSGDRSQAGPTAPAHGLTLVSVRYDPPVLWGTPEPP